MKCRFHGVSADLPIALPPIMASVNWHIFFVQISYIWKEKLFC